MNAYPTQLDRVLRTEPFPSEAPSHLWARSIAYLKRDRGQRPAPADFRIFSNDESRAIPKRFAQGQQREYLGRTEILFVGGGGGGMFAIDAWRVDCRDCGRWFKTRACEWRRYRMAPVRCSACRRTARKREAARRREAEIQAFHAEQMARCRRMETEARSRWLEWRDWLSLNRGETVATEALLDVMDDKWACGAWRIRFLVAEAFARPQ